MSGACGRGVCAANDGHEGTCAEASGWVTTCDDLGCVDGRTIQGRKYHYDGSVEEQWAPCGRMADDCPAPTAEADQ